MTPASQPAQYDLQLDRQEAKYIIPPALVPDIREFIRPFCEPDPHSNGEPPAYTVVTLQLDTPDLALHYAKENEALNRFKLRVRTYGEPGTNAVFMEIKRKIRGTVVKSRTMVAFEEWNERLLFDPVVRLRFRSSKEEHGFLEFRRLVQETGARPVVLVRYERESYFGRIDHYARVSFDRRLAYQPTRSWDSWGRGGRWFPMDSSVALHKQQPFSGLVLELKTLNEVPHWMVDLVVTFALERTGNCKYSNALWLESLFCGAPAIPDFVAAQLAW